MNITTNNSEAFLKHVAASPLAVRKMFFYLNLIEAFSFKNTKTVAVKN